MADKKKEKQTDDIQSYRLMKTDRQTDRQTEDKQTKRQTDKMTDRQNDRLTKWQTDKMTDRQKDKLNLKKTSQPKTTLQKKVHYSMIHLACRLSAESFSNCNNKTAIDMNLLAQHSTHKPSMSVSFVIKETTSMCPHAIPSRTFSRRPSC
jgi:hypothetical protein